MSVYIKDVLTSNLVFKTVNRSLSMRRNVKEPNYAFFDLYFNNKALTDLDNFPTRSLRVES